MSILREIVLEHKKKQHQYTTLFKETFGLNLKDFMDALTGFDIVKFDAVIECPDDVSLENYLKEISEEACSMIKDLL